MERTWIRIDRETGEKTECTEQHVRARIATYYVDIDLAIKNADENAPISTAFANYYSKS